MWYCVYLPLFIAVTTNFVTADQPPADVWHHFENELLEDTEHRVSFLTPGSETSSGLNDHRPECDSVGGSACVKGSCGPLEPHIIRTIHTDRELRIDWQAAPYINAPHAYHEISIWHSKSLVSVSRQNISPGTCVTMRAQLPTGDLFETELRAMTILHGLMMPQREPAYFKLFCLQPPKSAVVSVLNRGSDRIIFKVVPLRPARSIIRIGSKASLKKLEQGLEVEAFNLKPFKTIKVKVRSCILDEKTEILSCADDATFRMKTNVARPSRVRNLKILPFDSKMDRISFRRPEVPNGPIDEYRVVYKDLTSSLELEATLTTDGKIDFLDLNPLHSYKISVAACNLDYQNSSRWHVGDYEHVILPARPEKFWREVITFAIQCLFLSMSFTTLNNLTLHVFLYITLLAEHLNINFRENLQLFRVLMFAEFGASSF